MSAAARPPLLAPPLAPLLLACLGLVACLGGGAEERGGAGATTSHGRLVIVGGALDDDNAEVYRAIVEGRHGEGPLCVLPTASGVPASSMASAVETLTRWAGPDAVTGVGLTTENAQLASDPVLAAELQGCSGFFFTGGDQSRVVDTFLPAGDTTPAFRALRRRWTEGAVVAGSSAGAAMMSGVMIASGSSADAVAHGVVAHGVVDSEGDGVRVRRGMGFFERAILDQHFLARGRIGRLLVATLVTDSLPVGLGIDEDTALLVEGEEARVLGASGVVVVDARAAAPDGRYGSGVRVVLAGAGDRIDLRSFAVEPGPGKAPLATGGAGVRAPEDPFARWAFLHLLAGLAATDAREATFALPEATLTVRKGADFTAVRAPGEGVEGEPAGLSAGPFLVELRAAGS